MPSPIIRVTVETSLDPIYPFTRDLFDDKDIAYHGTWSTFCTSIEEHGMSGKYLPYRQDDIDALCRMGDKFGFAGDVMKGGLHVFDPCARGFKKGKRPICLARCYWRARGYSKNLAGETVRHALFAISDLDGLLTDPDLRQSHAGELDDRLHGLHGNDRRMVRQQLRNLEDTQLLETMLRNLIEVSERIRQVADGGYPVVYAVQTDEGRDDHRAADLEVTKVSAERIRARADFVRGVDELEDDALMPPAVPWDMSPYLAYVKSADHLCGHWSFLKDTKDPWIKNALKKVWS